MNWRELVVQINEEKMAETGSEQAEVVLHSFEEACQWSKENAGRAFVACSNGVDFQPVSEADAKRATESWHGSEELYIDGPYRDEMS